MAWNEAARPAGHRTSTTDKWRNVFEEGEAISFTLSAGDAPAWEVRNYYGTVVASGLISSSTVTVPPLPCGWYKIYFVRDVSIGSPWMTSGGEDSFVVTRAGSAYTARPPHGTGRVGTGGDVLVAGHDIPAVAYAGFGVTRFDVPYDNAATITGSASDADYFNTWWTTDAARPASCFASFETSYGLADDPTKNAHIASAIGTLYPKGVTMYEGFNEPNNFGSTVPNTITQLGLFRTAVKAANPSALVMGPATLSLAGNQTQWTEDVLAGAGSSIDVISFHNYNAGHDIPSIRQTLTEFEAMLDRTGQAAKPRFNSEFGSHFQAVYGSFEPRLQASRTMLELHMHEQHGVPKENLYYFYDWSHGFWSFPSFWILNESGEPHPGPLMSTMRTWSEEVQGKAFVERFDFGSENDHWVGSLFTNGATGDSVAIIQSGGRHGTVDATVTGASSLTKVDAFGNLSTVTVTGGTASLTIDELPSYYRLPAGVTLTPVAVDYGVDVIQRRNCVATASSADSPASRAISGTIGRVDGDQITGTDAPYHSDDAAGLPAWWEVEFPKTSRFNRVVVTCPPPWQLTSSLLDFDVQIWDGSGWQTVATDSEPTETFQWTSHRAMGGGFTDSYYSRRNVFVFQLNTVETTKLRIYARDVTAGGGAVPEVQTGYGIPGAECGQAGPKRLSLKQVQAFLSTDGDGGTATPGQPMLALR